jgi:hybrid cluster-associated redox disulfide protein
MLTITADLTLDELVTRFPATASVLVARRMHCVDCELARFETVSDAARTYRQALESLLVALCTAASQLRRTNAC